jgi:hypothetical protein
MASDLIRTEKKKTAGTEKKKYGRRSRHMAMARTRRGMERRRAIPYYAEDTYV